MVELKREEEVEVIIPTFEIKKIEIVIPTFAIKLKQVEEEEVMHKKAELNGIPKLVQEYTKKIHITSIIVGFNNRHSLKVHLILIVQLVTNFLFFQHNTP